MTTNLGAETELAEIKKSISGLQRGSSTSEVSTS